MDKVALKKLLREKRKAKRQNNGNIPFIPSAGTGSELDFTSMMQQMTTLLKNNPDMVKQVNTCVNKIMKDPELINKLTSQINSVNTVSESETSSDTEEKQVNEVET